LIAWLLCLLLWSPCWGTEGGRRWTVYLAQDKHLDYGWCGSITEIELRMASLLDYYLDLAEQDRVRWNLDGTIWDEVYGRHRGQAGSERLHRAIRDGRVGYVGNYAVLLWGILDTETAIRAALASADLERVTGMRSRTALVMENSTIPWGVANVLTECGFDFLGRGIYNLRAESYLGRREPLPLVWWQAPNGKRILMRWDLYSDTESWGGYAEGHTLVNLAGEKWDAFRVQSFGDRNSPEVFAKRKDFIRRTVERYEAYGANYPISSILLLGTGWDNWTQTEDLSIFIRKFNAESDGTIRLVDARYEDFFAAAEKEIREKNLTIPVMEGTFGICWEEWAAHLAGLTAQFRQAERLLRLAEAAETLKTVAGYGDAKNRDLIRHGFVALLRFAEHDFGGTDRERAALSAGARADAVTQATDIARSLQPEFVERAGSSGMDRPEETTFPWRGGRVVFDPNRCCVASVTDAAGKPWVGADRGPGFGEFAHTRYRGQAKPDSVFPEALPSSSNTTLRGLRCSRTDLGARITADFDRSGFKVSSEWLFHEANPWIDVGYHVSDGWTDDPQTVEFSFAFAMDKPVYRYDTPGAIVTAGPKQGGGDDLPGANPDLYASVTFAAASGQGRTALVLAPDSLLWRFGRDKACVTSMPMMNLTRNDHQFGQGGQRQWTFRYRIVLFDKPFDPLVAVQEAQRFEVPPFLHVPGQTPAVAGLAALDIDFPGGPLLAFKVAQDDHRVILRFWNVLDREIGGSFRLPSGWSQAQACDALERPQKPLEAKGDRVAFTVSPRGITTIALSPR
jgi:hypothetical protein